MEMQIFVIQLHNWLLYKVTIIASVLCILNTYMLIIFLHVLNKITAENDNKNEQLNFHIHIERVYFISLSL